MQELYEKIPDIRVALKLKILALRAEVGQDEVVQQHLATTLEEFQALGIDFVSYSQRIDTTTPAGKLTFHVLAAIAEFEREMIRERVRSGIAAAKQRGTKSGNPIGRPKQTASNVSDMRRLRKEGVSFRQIATRLGVSPGTVVNYTKS